MVVLEVRPGMLEKFATRLWIPGPVGELFAERGLFEFADGGAGQSFEENERIGKLPFGERLSQKGAKFFRRSVCPVFQNNSSEWALLPFGMRDADHRGFFDGRMPHQRVFYVHRTDPFTAGFDEIFGAVDDFHEAFVIDGGHVAGFEPPIFGPAMSLVRRIVVAGRYPGTANFQFAGGVAIARSFDRFAFEAFRPHDAEFNEGGGPALFCADFVLLVRGPVSHVAFEFADSGEWRGFRHPPEVENVEAVLVEGAHQTFRRSGTAANQANGPAEFPAARIFLERCEDAEPDGGNPARNGDMLLSYEIE